MSMPMPFNKKKELSTSEKIVQSFEQGKEEPAIAEELDIPVGFVIEHLRKKVSGYVDYHTRKRQQEAGTTPTPKPSAIPNATPTPKPPVIANATPTPKPVANAASAPKTKLVDDEHKVKLVDDEVISRSKPNEKFVPIADPNESMDDVLDRPEIDDFVLSSKGEKAEMPEVSSTPDSFDELPKKASPAPKAQQPAPKPVSAPKAQQTKPQPAPKVATPTINNNSEVKTTMSSHGFAEKMAKIAPIEIGKLDAQIKQIKDSTASKTNEAMVLGQKIESLKAEIVKAEKELALLNAELQTTDTAIADLNAERAEWAKFLQ